MRDRPRPQRGSRREHVDTATAVAGSFRPVTGESPSRIDASNLTAIPGRGIATSTALDDQLEVSAAAGDWPSSSLRHSVASPPHEELVQTTLQRSDRDDGFGFSLSNGVYDSGVYVSAVKEKGPAADKLLPYDRILKVTFHFYCAVLWQFCLSVCLSVTRVTLMVTLSIANAVYRKIYTVPTLY